MQKSRALSPSVQDDGASSRRSIHPLQSILRHRRIALYIVVGMGVVAIPVLISLMRRVHYAEAMLMVSPTTRTVGEDRESHLPRYAEYVNQQVLFVSREDVALDALDRLGGNRSFWQQPGESMRDAAVRLSKALRVTRVPDTTYIAVGLEAGAPDGLVEIVNAVLKAYLDKEKGLSQSGIETRTEALSRRASELQEEIQHKSDQLSGWSKELGVPAMEPAMLAPLIEGTETAQREAQARRVAAEARLGGVEARYKVLKEANAAERTVLVPDAELLQIRTVLLTRKNELKAKLFGLTPEHEGRKASESEIADIDAELAREDKAALDRQIRAAQAKLEEAKANELVVAQAEVADTKRYEQVVTQEMSSLKDRILRLYPESQAVQGELVRLRRQHSAVVERLDAMRLETHAPGFVQQAMAASLSEVPASRRAPKGVAMLVAVTLFLVFAVPVGMDLARNRVRTDSEVEGAVLSIPERKGDRDPLVQDQISRLALALDRERRVHNRSSFLFTSVMSGAGTSQIVLDVARELGKFGVSAVAVEANALKPDSRFGGNGHPGLAVGMSQGIGAADMVIPRNDAFPDRIAVGPTDGRTTLSGLEKLDVFLGQVLVHYAAALIDAPPILQSADTEFLASRAHAVVLIVEAERTPQSELDRANRILRQAGATVVITVMNRVRVWKDQGHHSALAVSRST